MKKVLALAFSAFLFLCTVTSVNAQQTYNFSFMSLAGTPGEFIAGSGSFTTFNNGLLESISGQVIDMNYFDLNRPTPLPVLNIAGLSSYAGANNTLLSNPTFVSFEGISFHTKDLGDYNIANSGSSTTPSWVVLSSIFNPDGYIGTAPGTRSIALSVIPVPEPETYAMMLAGLALMFGIARKRNQKEISA